jgi:Ribose/Galactose Isomerase
LDLTISKEGVTPLFCCIKKEPPVWFYKKGSSPMSLLTTVAPGRLLIASDHAGYTLKQALLTFLAKQVPQLQVEDFGCNGEQDVVDYPTITETLCQAMKPEEPSYSTVWQWGGRVHSGESFPLGAGGSCP